MLVHPLWLLNVEGTLEVCTPVVFIAKENVRWVNQSIENWVLFKSRITTNSGSDIAIPSSKPQGVSKRGKCEYAVSSFSP